VSTLTTAINVDIATPVAGTNATITNAYALRAGASIFTGNVTLDGGTANGVVYLNASKVATTGSALTFDGTTLVATATTGAATTYPAYFDNSGVGVGTGARIGFRNTAVSYGEIGYLYDGAFATIIDSAGSNNTRFLIAGTEQARLTSTGLGIGTTSPVGNFNVNTTGNTQVTISSGNTGLSRLVFQGQASNNRGFIDYDNTSSVRAMIFRTNEAEWMRLTSTGTLNIVGAGAAGTSQAVSINGSAPTNSLVILGSSGNVGLGTDTPGEKLEVSGNARVRDALVMQRSSSSSYLSVLNYGDTLGGTKTDNLSFGLVGAGDLLFYTNGTKRATLDSSGNLGLGVTPSASAAPTIEVGNAGNCITSRGAIDFRILSGAFQDGASSWKYAQSGQPVGMLQMVNGSFGFNNAPSGTAGNAVSFTTAMTLDASGRLLIGTTSSTVYYNSTQTYTASAVLKTNVSNEITDLVLINGNNDFGSTLDFARTNTSSNDVRFGLIGGVPTSNTAGSEAGYVYFATKGTADTNVVERARITSGGSLQLGSATNAGARAFIYDDRSNSANADEAALCVREDGTNAIQTWLGSGGAERARITSGGGFLVGRQAAIGSELLCVEGSNADFLSRIRNTSATTPSGLFVSYTAAAPNGTGSLFLRCDDSAATRAEIRSNGGLANYQSNNVDLSDARTKTDINPLGSYWSKIAGLEIVTYKYKDQTHDDLNIGVIAQQVEAVAPEFVDSDGFGETPEDGVPLKTIYNKDLTFAAIKALQEAMARIETLEAEVAALKGA
jgi:hypothetical protein